jgi:predicted PurR-regulated permease PerM
MASSLAGSRPPLSTLLGIVLVTGCLYWARAVAIPFALAALLAFLLAPLVAALERKRIRPAVAVILVVVLAVSSLGAIAQVIGYEISVLAEELPRYQGNILAKIVHVRGIQRDSALGRLLKLAQDMSQQVERREGRAAQPERPVPVVVQPPSLLQQLPALLPVLAMTGLVLVLLVFMLLRREDLRNRLIRLFGYQRLALTTKALDEAGGRITQYLVRQAAMNTSFGLGVVLGLSMIGVPYAALWGFLATMLRFVPYLGVVVAMLLPTLLSLAVFPGWTQPLAVIALIASLELTIYIAIEPWFYGSGVGVSEVAILAGLAFWSWLWGPIGVLLATPMTVCFVVLGKHVPGLAPIALLLSDAPVIAAPLVFYQRLIAKDHHETGRVVRQYLEAHSREQVFDDLLLPAIARTGRDYAAGILTDQDRRFVMDTIDTIALGLGGTRSADDVRTGDGRTHRVDSNPADDGGLESTGLGRPRALGFPVQDDADELSLKLLALLLDPAGQEMAVMSSRLLASEMLAAVEREAPAAVCIGAVSPGGFAQTRYLVKRLRARFPEIGIVVGRWGTTRQPPREWRDRLLSIGANHVGSTLRDVRAHLVDITYVGSSEEPRTSPPAPTPR